MTYTIVICYPCPVTRQQRAQSSSIWSMVTASRLPPRRTVEYKRM